MFQIGKKYCVAHKDKEDGVVEGWVEEETEDFVFIRVSENDLCRRWHKQNIKYFHLLDEETPQEKSWQLREIMRNREQQQSWIEKMHTDVREKEFEYTKSKILHSICTLRQGGHFYTEFRQKDRAKEILDFFAHPLLKLQYEEQYYRIRVDYPAEIDACKDNADSGCIAIGHAK